ncbi:MAG: zinc ribbon domain-containing protein [Planctomycetes bacterium]|nr:zinc ribbon domain-containing protein [Planctomycetota bacterium]MCB9909469.1 zinc ribbon domain-containing protein [Planctomycetota bacterium]HPF13573.1 zinc ribbon domain-containing protein [Planctomycetota bacterium]HRV81403.1 zinc ribbon domain-containing protein [Planctomycetota bacterium]
MPTYDYRCQACGHTFELFQSMSEAVKRKCPKCSANKLERLIGMGAGILFKGGGFYQTDYRSDAYKKSQAADKQASVPAPEAKPTSEPKPKAEPKKGASKASPKATKNKPSKG